MQLLNDNKNERVETPNSSGFLSVVIQVFFSGVAMASVVFAPLPQIVAHFLYDEPWPKITAILGAVFALVVLQIPAPLVIFFFILSVVVGDGVARAMALPKLMGLLLGVAAAVGLGLFALMASRQGVPAWTVWEAWVGQMVTDLQAEPNGQWLLPRWQGDWNVMREYMLYRGPFLFAAAAVLCHWLSVGLASHMKWIPEDHPYGGALLRQSRFPLALSVAFLVAFLTQWSVPAPLNHWFEGAVTILSVFLFIDGCLQLSTWMDRRGVRPRQRTLVYVFSVLVGFYALVGVGMFRPWIQLISSHWRTKDENHTP